MLVLGVNKACGWCQIVSGGRTYTCPTKRIDGKQFFKFKREWHEVAKLASEHAHELVEVGGRLVSRPYSG